MCLLRTGRLCCVLSVGSIPSVYCAVGRTPTTASAVCSSNGRAVPIRWLGKWLAQLLVPAAVISLFVWLHAGFWQPRYHECI